MILPLKQASYVACTVYNENEFTPVVIDKDIDNDNLNMNMKKDARVKGSQFYTHCLS